MGSEGDSKRIEETVGGLVWVRRRNGSWWPGRIMGLHELPESCLVSPRSGTPVKLLGREDASVDWYNLDKSRRVKAFRCGEYDECIEKARASATSGNKKAVKYARREDAILHALELEGTIEPEEIIVVQPKKGNSGRKKKGLRGRKPKHISSSDSGSGDMNGTESMVEANKTKDLSQSGLTFEDPNNASAAQAHCLQNSKRRTPNDSEDDGSEGTKRMRGLEDLGMGVLSKREESVHSDSEGSDELADEDSSSFSEPNVCSSLSNGSPVNKSKDSSSNPRKRPAQVALGHENSKRKNRCLPLTKVLESTAMVSVPVYCDQGASPGRSSLQGAEDSKISALESTDSQKTSISVINNNKPKCTGALGDKETSLDASATGIDAGQNPSEIKSSEVSANLELPKNGGTDGLFDVPFVGEETHIEDLPGKLQLGASERNSDQGPTSNEGLDESGSTSITVNADGVTPMSTTKHTSKWQMKGKRNSRSQTHRPSIKLEHKHGMDTIEESLAMGNSVHWNTHESELDYGGWNSSSRECVDQPVTEKRVNLAHEKSVATKLRNKEMYLRDESGSPPVPYRSLPYRQSRFTPHSKYQDGYVSSRHTSYEHPSLYDVNVEVQSSYRRHVPLVSLMSKLNGKAIIGHPVTVEVCEEGYCDRFFSSIEYLASSSCEQYETGYSPSPVKTCLSSRKSKSPKGRKCGLLSKKTRKLSSFVAPDRSREQDRKPVVEKVGGGPVVACVPLNIVFSRINEALNGHSTRSNHRKLTLGNV
ncbi:hypothetical protein ACHQM5_001897 [Ranunculus cassubicifolius]